MCHQLPIIYIYIYIYFPIVIYLLSNATVTNYFIIFLQIIDVTNFNLFSSGPITNITFLFTINYSPNQRFLKMF